MIIGMMAVMKIEVMMNTIFNNINNQIMANFSIRIDLLKLQGAFLRQLQGNTQTKKCIIIPVEDCPSIYLGEKGCYLNLVGLETREAKYGDTHLVKGDIPKDIRERMSQEQLRANPIIGNMKPMERSQQQMQVAETLAKEAFVADSEGDDQPF